MRHIRMLLWPFALCYRLGIFVRNLLFDTGILKSHTFRTPVISIGNITAGGTGKTPHVEYLAGWLRSSFRIAVLSRGYKRRSAGFQVVKQKSAVISVGDEPLQIKRKFPSVQVVVDRRRVHGIRTLKKRKPAPDIIILDDAFQHRYVKPGLSILLVDYNRPVFHDMMLPAGNLREPWRNTIRADIIVVTKCPPKLDHIERARFISRLKLRSEQDMFFTTFDYGQPHPVYRKKNMTRRNPDYRSLRKEQPGILLVTGIADPMPLRKFLSQYGEVHDELVYPDHHHYNKRDLAKIGDRYRQLRNKVNYVFVTEKDAIRLREVKCRDRQLQKAMFYVPVEVRFLAKGEKPFMKRVAKFLKKRGKAISLWDIKK